MVTLARDKYDISVRVYLLFMCLISFYKKKKSATVEHNT